MFEEPSFLEGNCLLARLSKHNIVIVSIYRSPSYKTTDPFLESLHETLLKLKGTNTVMLIGDINIPINHDKIDQAGENYLTLAASHGLLPAHIEITRAQTGTCLDHVLLKSSHSTHVLIPQATLTDHYPVLVCMDFNIPRVFANTTYSITNKENLTQDLHKIELTPINQSQDPEYSINYLTTAIQDAINKNTVIIFTSRRKKIIKPWITPGLLRCMRNRDRLNKKLKSSPDNEILKLTYTRYRNFCNAILKKVKRAYEKSEVEKTKDDPKKLWKTLRDISNMNNSPSHTDHLLKINSSPDKSLNEINSYFINVGKNLAEECQKNIQHDSVHVLKENNRSLKLDSFVLEDTSEDEVSRLIMGLKTECSVGRDNISNKLLKQHSNFLVPPLTLIFNNCLHTGIFPSQLKSSEVRPIFKGGDKKVISNYRPISILPAISKLLEKIINNRLTKYLEKNNLLAEKQFGFRAGRSTDEAVYTLTNYISTNLDKGRKCLSIFLDLKKAFDTISIPILITKLEKLGIRGSQLQFFESYLTGRNQCVRIGDHVSTDLPVSYGIPQGSILGPTLFLIYINDLTGLNIPKCDLISYADDTVLFFAADAWDEVFIAAQTGLDIVNNWLRHHLLTLNSDKTKYLTFCIRQSMYNSNNYNIVPHQCSQGNNCACKAIERVHKIKYLGVIIDSNLSFKDHIKLLSSRIRKLIYVFKRLRHVVDPLLLKQIYFALCQSIISYCISSWGGSPKTVIKPVEIAQRAILKICTFKPRFFSTTLLYQYCEVLNVRQLFLLTIILRQHKQIIYDPKLTLRRRNRLVCTPNHQPHTSFIKRFFVFLGPFVYNKINSKLNIYSLNKTKCKNKVKEFLLTLTYEETEKLIIVSQ